MAATAFAAVLIAIVKSDVVKTLLTGLIKKALSVANHACAMVETPCP